MAKLFNAIFRKKYFRNKAPIYVNTKSGFELTILLSEGGDADHFTTPPEMSFLQESRRKLSCRHEPS
jgi:hypothetical protein